MLIGWLLLYMMHVGSHGTIQIAALRFVRLEYQAPFRRGYLNTWGRALMNRFGQLLIVFALVLLPMVGWEVSVHAQGAVEAPAEGELWEGVEQPVPDEGKSSRGQQPLDGGEISRTGGGNQILLPFDVAVTMEYAAIPAVEDTEYLIIDVVEGQFALDQGDTNAIVVDPAEDAAGEVAIQFMTPYSPDPPHYDLDPDGARVTTEDGEVCTSMCVIPANSVVQIDQGDTIFAQPGAVCVLCLQNSGSGLLRVSPLLPETAAPEDFSWFRAYDNRSVASESNDSTSMIGWALNPGTNCRGG